MTPHPHTSTGLPYGSLLTTSGAMKWGVPTRPGDRRQTFKTNYYGIVSMTDEIVLLLPFY